MEIPMHKTILSFAALVAAAGFLTFGVAAVLHSVPESQAQDFGPVVTGGENPWIYSQGDVAPNTTVTAYTVPADRSFVLTAACFDDSLMDLQEITALSVSHNVVQGQTFAALCNTSNGGGFLARGTGHIVFGPEAQVRVRNRNASDTREYIINGYLVLLD